MLNANRATGMVLLLSFAGIVGLGGCANKTQEGAAIGVGAGAVVGGAIGKATGNTARGAIIGAAVGGIAGSIIGSRMDKQAKELDKEIPGATVTRVGEGIAVTFDSGLLSTSTPPRSGPRPGRTSGTWPRAWRRILARTFSSSVTPTASARTATTWISRAVARRQRRATSRPPGWTRAASVRRAWARTTRWPPTTPTPAASRTGGWKWRSLRMTR